MQGHSQSPRPKHANKIRDGAAKFSLAVTEWQDHADQTAAIGGQRSGVNDPGQPHKQFSREAIPDIPNNQTSHGNILPRRDGML